MYDTAIYEICVSATGEDVPLTDFVKLFKLEYEGHSVNFWMDLQRFHDNNGNWTANDIGNELTESGVKTMLLLRKKYSDG